MDVVINLLLAEQQKDLGFSESGIDKETWIKNRVKIEEE